MAEQQNGDTSMSGDSSDTNVNGVPNGLLSKKEEKTSDSQDVEMADEQSAEAVFQITVKLPHKPYQIQVMVSTQEQVQDLRQSIVELPDTFQYSCFHLEHNGARVNDFVELSEVKGLAAGGEMKLVEDPYTEKEARIHMVRIRELIGAAGDRVDTLHGISAGLSLHDNVVPFEAQAGNSNGSKAKKSVSDNTHSMEGYDFDAQAPLQTILSPPIEQPPKTIKSLSVSPWNPPPYHLRQKGHLLYLQLTTNEGKQHQITSHVSGFFVNKSSDSNFDPYPRPQPKNAAAHSLLALITKLSPSFETSFLALQEHNSKMDPLANFQITNTIPSNPWLVSTTESSLSIHQPDITRTQETYLMSGIENAETLRDWNEEFQSTRELPRETVQDRVFRERLTSKLFADYNDAAARGAIMVARGEVAPLNPTEIRDAQIFVYNNVFFSFGADGVGTFTSEGGDEAARIAVGKDVAGARVVNQLDIPDLFTPGTVIVDYLGKRLVGQSIVPGIFKQREPGENQIDYGGVEGRDIVAESEAFVPVFSKLSKALRVKKHDVWDKEGKKHTLEGSVETKGLLGTDGRKYILDLYRLTPLDITWLEQCWSDVSIETVKSKERNYPHRMAVLRPELIEAYWHLKMEEYVEEEVERRRRSKNASTGENRAEECEVKLETNGTVVEKGTSAVTADTDKSESSGQEERVDISGFNVTLNPDVFCSQSPQTDEEREELAQDEKEVRAVCTFLHEKIVPDFVHDLQEGDVGFPMDGRSLARLMHKRGINIRYLGKLATLAKEQGSRLAALKSLAVQEMIARSFKHSANHYMKDLPPMFATACLAHLLNCLLGADYNKSPQAELDEEMQSIYTEADWAFTQVNPQSFKSEIEAQVHLRYRYSLDTDWTLSVKPVQLLRELALKVGLQLAAKDYQFASSSEIANGHVVLPANGASSSPTTISHLPNGTNGKRRRKNGELESGQNTSELASSRPVTFNSDDIVNIFPVVKDACPRSALAEEALEAGRMSMMQNQKDLGQDLLLESLSLHEQIYGILHPEVARVYRQLSMLYYQLDEKGAAVELARKAVIVSERTLGVDSDETVLSYLNLGLFEHGNGNTRVALTYMRHALDVWKIIYGPNHPDSITTLNNAAVMLQHLKHYHESRLWFEHSLAICEAVSGKQSINTATLSFQLAQALALDQDAKAAVNRMREAYSIFLAKLGPEDRNTKESESWLEQLIHNAVSIAKHAKDLQARRIRRVQLTPRVTLGTRPQPQVGQTSAEAANGRDLSRGVGLDSRAVDELVRFIEGGGDTSTRKSGGKRAGRGNPKRRGGGMLGTAV